MTGDRHGPDRRTVLRTAGILGLTPALPLLAASRAAATTPCPRGPFAPLPPAAAGPPVPAAGYLVQEIGEDLFWVTDGSYHMMFLDTHEGVVAVDAPPTLGNNILRAIRSVTRRPVTHVVYSHQHADHIGAASLYPDTARRYAHRATAEILRRVADPHRPAPNRVFDRSLVLRAGGHRLHLDWHGPNHAPGNIFIHAPRQQVLMLVDVIFPGWVPFADLAVSSDIPGWVDAHDRALEYPFETLVGGHVTRLGTRDDVSTQRDYITELRQRAEAELSNVDFGAVLAGIDPANQWAVFDAYLDAVATQTTDYITPRWVDRLGGADVFTKSNAFAMAEAVRIDYGALGPFGIHP